MPQREEVAAKESYLLGKHSPAANTDAVVTLTALPAGRYALHGVTFSASGAIAAAVLATITNLDDGAGNAVTMDIRIPAATVAPIHINFNKSLVSKAGVGPVITLPALGAGISGSVDVCGAKINR